MSVINVAKRQINAKIVYYGPGLSGKTTNLLNIHSRMPASSTSSMQSIATLDERTLFFDFVPIEQVRVGGWDIRFHLYSVPGQEDYVRTRRAILGGADGVVFVADSEPERLEANAASIAELHEHLAHHQRSVADTPVVLQYNKRDLDEVVPVDELRSRLNPDNWAEYEASALNGYGVAATLTDVSRRVARLL